MAAVKIEVEITVDSSKADARFQELGQKAINAGNAWQSAAGSAGSQGPGHVGPGGGGGGAPMTGGPGGAAPMVIPWWERYTGAGMPNPNAYQGFLGSPAGRAAGGGMPPPVPQAMNPNAYQEFLGTPAGRGGGGMPPPIDYNAYQAGRGGQPPVTPTIAPPPLFQSDRWKEIMRNPTNPPPPAPYQSQRWMEEEVRQYPLPVSMQSERFREPAARQIAQPALFQSNRWKEEEETRQFPIPASYQSQRMKDFADEGGTDWQKSLRRLLGGRPRGLSGLASLAGASMVAGAAAHALRENMDIEHPERLSGNRLGWEIGERLPIIGGLFELGRLGFTDQANRMAIAQQSRLLTEQMGMEGHVQSSRNAIQAHLQQLQQTQFSPAGETAAASAFRDKAVQHSPDWVHKFPMLGERSEYLGERRQAVQSASATVTGAEHTANLAAGAVAKAQQDANEARQRAAEAGRLQAQWGAKADELGRSSRFIPLGPGFVAQGNMEDFRPGSGMRLGQRDGADANFLAMNVQGNARFFGEANINRNQQAQAADERLNEARKQQERADKALAESRDHLEKARLMVGKGERFDVLANVEGAMRSGFPQLYTAPPGEQTHWAEAVHRMMRGGIKQTGPGDWDVLLGNPLSRPKTMELMGQEAGNIPGVQQAIKELMPNVPGNLQGVVAEKEKLDAEIRAMQAELTVTMKNAFKVSTDSFVSNVSEALIDMGVRIEQNIRNRFGIDRQQRAQEQDARIGGGH